MKLQVLGSAAAEGQPALFCECDLCKKARKTLGKDVRRRCCYLVNDNILVDFGPDIYWQSIQFGIDLSKIDAIFFTHAHEDHCNPVDLLWRQNGFSKVSGNIDIYGNQAVMDKLSREFQGNWDKFGYTQHLVLPGQSFQSNGFTVTPIRATHSVPPEIPLNYVIQAPDGTTALIGNDSGWWCDESWDILKNFKLDIAIVECTFGLLSPNEKAYHLGCQGSIDVFNRLKEQGTVTDSTFKAVNHFSHNALGLQEDYEKFFNPHGIHVCYDGMLIEH